MRKTRRRAGAQVRGIAALRRDEAYADAAALPCCCAVREIAETGVAQVFAQGSVLTQLCLCNPPHHMLFAGTAHGCVRALPFPIPTPNGTLLLPCCLAAAVP